MPLYLTNTKGKDDHKLIKAISAKAAEDAFLGRPDLETRTITDAAEGAELAAQYEMINATDPAPSPPPSPPSAAATDPKTGSAGDDDKGADGAKDTTKSGA